MADTNWASSMTYEAKGLGNMNYTMYRIPVTFFGVKGGAKRRIFLSPGDDMSMIHEIEQARRLKNLTVGLLVAENYDWVWDLLEIAARDFPVTIQLFVDGSIGATRSQSFRLICKDAKITQPQEPSQPDGMGNRFLAINLAINETRLVHGSYQNGILEEEDW